MIKKLFSLFIPIALSSTPALPMKIALKLALFEKNRLEQAKKDSKPPAKKSVTPPPATKFKPVTAQRTVSAPSAPIDIKHPGRAKSFEFKTPAFLSESPQDKEVVATEDSIETTALVTTWHTKECFACQIVGALANMKPLAKSRKLFSAVFSYTYQVAPTIQNLLYFLHSTKCIIEKHQPYAYFALPGKQILKVRYKFTEDIITITDCSLIKQTTDGSISATHISLEDDDLLFAMDDFSLDDGEEI